MWENFLKDLKLPDNALDQVKEFIAMFMEARKNESKTHEDESEEETMFREFSDKMSDAVGLVLEKGMLFKHALGLSDEHMESFYAWGYDCFIKRQYQHALIIFKTIVMFDPTEWKYHYALATTLHKQKNFQEASTKYLLSAMIDPSKYSPFAHYHRADCLLQMNDIPGASIALHFCLQNCDPEETEHALLCERAHILKQSLDNQLSAPLKG